MWSQKALKLSVAISCYVTLFFYYTPGFSKSKDREDTYRYLHVPTE